MAGCYIIHSCKLNRFYVGATQVDVFDRIDKHNAGSYGHHRFTSTANDRVLYLYIPSTDYSQAIRIERRIKSMIEN